MVTHECISVNTSVKLCKDNSPSMNRRTKGSELAKRFQKVIDERYDGNISEFGRACQKIDDGVKRTHVASILDRYSVPRLDIAAVMAEAGGVTLDWLAGIEAESPRNREGFEGMDDLLAEATGEKRSVQPEGPPEGAVWPGYAFGLPGEEQLTIDFVIRGKTSRGSIPLSKREAD